MNANWQLGLRAKKTFALGIKGHIDNCNLSTHNSVNVGDWNCAARNPNVLTKASQTQDHQKGQKYYAKTSLKIDGVDQHQGKQAHKESVHKESAPTITKIDRQRCRP